MRYYYKKTSKKGENKKIVFAILFLILCKEEKNVKPFEVLSYFPKNGEVGVDTKTEIYVEGNGNLQKEFVIFTIKAIEFPIAGTIDVQYQGENVRISFKPLEELPKKTTIISVFQYGANTLVWTFSTGPTEPVKFSPETNIKNNFPIEETIYLIPTYPPIIKFIDEDIINVSYIKRRIKGYFEKENSNFILGYEPKQNKILISLEEIKSQTEYEISISIPLFSLEKFSFSNYSTSISFTTQDITPPTLQFSDPPLSFCVNCSEYRSQITSIRLKFQEGETIDFEKEKDKIKVYVDGNETLFQDIVVFKDGEKSENKEGNEVYFIFPSPITTGKIYIFISPKFEDKSGNKIMQPGGDIICGCFDIK